MKSRIIFIFVGILVLWTLLLARAFSLQIVPDDRLKALEARQFSKKVTLNSRRGAIVDRNGRELAISTTSYSLYADPKIMTNKRVVARQLGKILNEDPKAIFEKIKSSERRFVWIERQLSHEVAEQLKGLEVRGLGTVEEFRRIYPNESLLAPTLGFVGKEGRGLEGLELALNEQLEGNKRKITVKRDARGRPLVADGLMFAENPDGAEIKLTIDAELQHMLENELIHAVEEFDAERAYGVILDAKTSAVLSLATLPGFDANRAAQVSPEVRRNRTVTDTFEPGSTMKTFVVATALREKLLAPNTRYNTENGSMRVGDRIIREAEAKHKWSSLTTSEILAYSSNVGTTKIAFDLGPQLLRQGLLDFGFGAKSGLELPGEPRGSLANLPWRQHLMANISFGHGMTANSIQMANAYAVIANSGVLHQPYLIQSIRDPETGRVTESEPKILRQVLTSSDAAQMRLMLTGVTAPGGTGVNAKVDGFLVGGKTGTAQKVNPNGRGYLPGAYISSFAGFIPANDPKFVIYIAVDHPKQNAFYGSQVAAPVFSRVASYAVRQAGLAPVFLSEKNLPSQDIKKEFQDGQRVIASTVKKQKKVNPKKLPQENQVKVLESPLKTSAELARLKTQTVETVPDLQGLSLREVLRRVNGTDLQIQVRGTGLVAETYPTAGEVVPDSRTIQVLLK
ncbi:MAG: penicillin-binding protein [Pseudobdellovibrionaceae bacterium]